MAILRVSLALLSIPIALILVAPIALAGVPFWVVGWLSRSLARRLEPSHVAWNEVLEYEPVIGWKPRANLDTRYLDRVSDVCHVVTDSQGWVGRRSVADSPILVFGDSFVFGYGVDAEASYAQLVSGASVKGIGAPGYNMVQGLLRMRDMSHQLKDKLVCWFICLDNDLYDNLHPNKPNYYTAPFVRKVNETSRWEVVTHHVRASKTYQASGRSPYYSFPGHLCSPGPISERAYSACDYLIAEAKAICDSAGATLVVVTIPNKNQLSAEGVRFLASRMYNPPQLDPGYPDLKLGEACRRLGLRFVALKEHLSPAHYKTSDDHWNESGHRKVAEILDQVYREYLSGPARTGASDADRAAEILSPGRSTR